MQQINSLGLLKKPQDGEKLLQLQTELTSAQLLFPVPPSIPVQCILTICCESVFMVKGSETSSLCTYT